MNATTDQFPRDTTGLVATVPSEVIDLAAGEVFDLRIAPVTKRIGDATVRMLAYNGSIPGPTLRVKEGSEITVNVVNEGDLEATVHWHGLRLENRYDGTHETQDPIPVGGTYTARVAFPDPGVYWYHPHTREDYGQEMGLYGNVVVEPRDPDYWPPAHREVALTVDDVLIEDGAVAPFSRSETTHSAMGRFGNVLLVAGQTDLALRARWGEVIRFYLTNTANTRVFRVQLPGARMKLVGGDSGRHEREELVEHVTLAPSERVVVDVLFEEPGRFRLEHLTPERVYPLASIDVSQEAARPALAEQFEVLRRDDELTAKRTELAPYLAAEPDKKLAFIAEMDMEAPEGPVVYACPMHPEVVSEEPGHCPKCGMKLLAVEAPATTYTCPMHPEVVSEEPGHCPECGMKLLPSQLVAEAGGGGQEHHGHDHAAADGIEWEDDMVEVNRLTTPANMRWKLIDRDTGAENAAIDWKFQVGDRVKIRLLNEMAGDHPMHHPFHVHGAGRFLILSRDGVPEPNLVWKDTVLVRTGETVDILLEVTNPGRWMAHCHIAEHHESGMMFSFDVAPAGGRESSRDRRLQAAVEAQVAAGAPGALARIETPQIDLAWEGSAGNLARGTSRPLRPDDAFRAASVTKHVTAAVTVRLAQEARLALDEPLAGQLDPALLQRWRVFDALPRTTPRQLVSHTSGLPNYFGEASFLARLREDPGRTWRSVDLVDHAAEHGTPGFAPGEGFDYTDTGFVIAGILIEEKTGRQLHEVYRELVFDPLGMHDTWLEGHEPPRRAEVAHHYTDELDWTTISPTIDWAAGGLVTTARDLARYVRGLWSERIVDAAGLRELTRWTPGASFPPGHRLRYERYGLGIGANTVEGVELLGHTGFIGAFAFYAPEYDAILVGTHNTSDVDRWPLVEALCRELGEAA